MGAFLTDADGLTTIAGEHGPLDSIVTPAKEGVAKGSEKKGTTKDTKSTKEKKISSLP